VCVVECYVVDGALVGMGVTLSCSAVDLFPAAQHSTAQLAAAVDRSVCHFPNDQLLVQFVDTSPYYSFFSFYLHSVLK